MRGKRYQHNSKKTKVNIKAEKSSKAEQVKLPDENVKTANESSYEKRTKCVCNTNLIGFYDFIKKFIFTVIVLAFVFTFVVKGANVVGLSMANTLQDSDKVLLTNYIFAPKPGDIVAINAEDELNKKIVKRVIACAGQTIRIDYDNQNVIVDGIVTYEPYVSSQTKEPGEYWSIPRVIPEGYVFVMGDNRAVSLDSRDKRVGLVSIKKIIGKAQLVVYPFDRIEYLYKK